MEQLKNPINSFTNDVKINARVFNLSNEKDLNEYLAIVNDQNFRPFKYPSGQIIAVSSNWDGPNYHLFMEWFDKMPEIDQ